MKVPEREVEVPHFLAVAAAYSWRFLTVVAAAAVVVFALVTLRLIVIPVFVALLLSTLLVPIAGRLRRLGAPKLLAAWGAVLTGLGVLALIVFLIVPPVAEQMDDVGRDARRGLEDTLAWLTEGPLDLSRAEVDNYTDRITEQLRASSGSLVSGAFKGVYIIAELVAGLLLTLVLTFFFVKDGSRLADGLLALFAERRRNKVRDIASSSWTALGAYMRGTALVGVFDALAIGLALVIVGVPLAMPLAILTFLGAFFPLIGAVVAGTLATLVALVTTGVVPALVIAAVTIVVQQVEGDVLQPMVLGRAVQLHPLVILLSLTGGAIVAGIAGAFLAVPLAAVTSVAVSHLRNGSSEPVTTVRA